MSGVVIYTTRFCPYCSRARALLDSKGVSYSAIDVDTRPDLREEMMIRSGRHTVPQIWIGEDHIGGCDDLYRLDYEGLLDTMLAATLEKGGV